MAHAAAITVLLLASLAALHAADIELTETLQLPECHSIGWVRAWVKADPQARGKGWDGVLDEAKWGTPSPRQLVVRNWARQITDEQRRQAVQQKGEGKREDVKFDLWIPDGVEVVKGIVAISGHGSGERLYQHPGLRAIARELHLAIFKFLGNPMQRGFRPKSLLYERLKGFGGKSQHPELEHAPLFLYGHSNGTGFSAIFPATEGHRVWGWVSMRPGITFQVYQPGAAQVPGLVIFGENDHFLARPSKEENLAVVPLMRRKHSAIWNFAVEPKTGHGPGKKTWPLVFSFLRHTFAARVPGDADPRKGPVELTALRQESGHFGKNWDAAKGGYQALSIAPFDSFAGDKTVASWLINAAYAADWQAFQRDGQVKALGSTAGPALSARNRHDANVLPKGREYFDLRDGLANCHLKLERGKTARIAFLGGSITAGGGWRDHIIRYFLKRFPQTELDFISAGISSLGSVPHAFRLERDVLSRGPVDLLFVEAAVNDTSNTADPNHMLRGMEGVVRHMRTVNPLTDIIHLHFVMPPHMEDYNNKGRVPVSIAQHEKVAAAYGNATLNLSLEVTERINAGEFTWKGDFKNLHPSPFGHQLYANSITRMTEAAFAQPLPAAAKPHPLPAPVDPKSYSRGRFGNLSEVRIIKGFTLDPSWRPTDKKGTRAGFVNVLALVGAEPGAEFEFSFDGTGAGLFITSGPDAGRIECSIDGSAYREIETFTCWSRALHLPWAVILDDGLKSGHHTVRVRIATGQDAKATGTALRVFHLLLN